MRLNDSLRHVGKPLFPSPQPSFPSPQSPVPVPSIKILFFQKISLISPKLARFLLVYKCWRDKQNPDAIMGCQPMESARMRAKKSRIRVWKANRRTL